MFVMSKVHFITEEKTTAASTNLVFDACSLYLYHAWRVLPLPPSRVMPAMGRTATARYRRTPLMGLAVATYSFIPIQAVVRDCSSPI